MEENSATTKIRYCNCSHEYQDQKYGKNKRVFNRTSKQVGTSYKWRCTVCKTEI